MNTIKQINDEYINMFINEKETLVENKNFYLEANDGSILCKYNKWNQNPEERKVKWFPSYKTAKSFINKNHLGIVSIKDRDFTKKEFNTKDKTNDQVTEAEQINPIRFEKYIYTEFKNWFRMLQDKYKQGNFRTLKVIRKVFNLFIDDERLTTPVQEAFSPNQNEGNVKVTMFFKDGKFVNWSFDGKPKTQHMLNITKKLPFIKNNLKYNKDKKIFYWKKPEKDNDVQKKEQPDDKDNNKDKDTSKGNEQNLTEDSVYEKNE